MLYEFLKNKMLKNPNQVISNDTESITYGELLAYAESFGKTLTKDKYGLLFDSDLNTAKALLACLYANKTAVLLSKRYGEAHTQRIIDTVKLSYLITEDGIKHIFDEQDECEDLSDVALIMCTSGTTGKPKGAMITYDNLITNLTDISKYFGINCSDHILIARPLYHCAVLTGEFLISLCKGLRISFMTEGFVPIKILKKAKETSVTTLCGTPTLLYHLSAMSLKSKEALVLKNIAVSGECMTQTVAQIMREAFPNTDIYNVYGLTEASPRVSYLPPDEFDNNPTSVGVPLSSLKAKIVDNELLIFGDKCVIDIIKNIIDEGFYVTFNDIDAYYIKGKCWYKEQHFNHEGMIIGYDDEKNTFIMVGYDQRWIYTVFETPQECFVEGMNSSCEQGVYGWLYAIKAKNEIYELNTRDIYNNLKKYLSSDINIYPLNTNGMAHGIVVYDFLCIYLDKLLDGSIPHHRRDRRGFRMLWEHKKCMLGRIRAVEKLCGWDDKLSSAYEKVVGLADKVRFIYSKFVLKYSSKHLEKMQLLLMDIKSSELDLLTKFLLKLEEVLNDGEHCS